MKKENKVLFVSCVDFISDSFSGGKKLSLSHYNLFKELYGEKNVKLCVLADGNDTDDICYLGHTKNKISTFKNTLFKYVRGYSKKSEKKILNEIKIFSPSLIFFDFSCYGNTIKKIKKKNSIPVISFFHNVESDYEKNRMKESKLYYFSMKSALKLEKMTCKFSDKIISLNHRDTTRIYEKYGRKADLELPIFLEDKHKEFNNKNEKEDYLLFVGAVFGPNVDGIKWYKENIADKVKYPTLVVGKDFETLKKELETNQLKIIGTVDNLDSYYNNAKAVIMPIRYGDGMKVKTAEALMYGKTVIGTDEAFEGYNISNGIHGYNANTPEEFINAINNNVLPKNNIESRNLYIKEYSHESSKEKLSQLLKNIVS